MKIKRLVMNFILSGLIAGVFCNTGFLYAGNETVISDFETPLDVRLWALSIPDKPGEKPEQAGIEHETKITAHGKGAMKFSMVFKSDGHERMNFEKSVDLPVKDASKDRIEFFINPDELDKQNYDLKMFIVDNNGEVWVHGMAFASLSNGWNQIKIGFNEFRFAWGGDGDGGNDGLIDGSKIGLIFFMFSDEPVIKTGGDSAVTAVFYLDDIKYVQDLAGVADKQPAAEKPSKNEPGKETVRAVNLPELGYFESREDIDRWVAGDGVKLELLGEHVTQGDSSVRITFPVPSPPEKQTQIISLKYPAYSSNDWSDYGMLIIDYYNPNDFTVRLLIEIHGLATAHFELPPSRQFIQRISLLTPIDFLNAEGSYPIDNAKEIILSTNFYTPNPADSPDIVPKTDKVTLFIDNIRLINKKEATDFIENLCPIEPKNGDKQMEAEIQDGKGAPETYPEFTPVLERDFIFMPSSHSSWHDEAIMSPLFEELGFLKLGYGPVMMWYPESSFTRVNYGGYEFDLKSTCVPQFKHFAERHLPFFVGTFSGWEAGQPLDIRLERSRKVTQWADEIGGKYFLGVRWGESDGIAYYFKTVQEKTNRIERANAYIELVKKLRERTGIPSGKLLITYPSIFFNYGMDFEAGVDVINRVTPGQWNNLEINFAQLRGASRSFNGTRYGMGTATDPACHVPSYYDKKSGRYDGIKKMDYSWRWSQEDIFKFWIHNYYNGGSYLDPYYQPPLADGKPTEYTKTMLKFLDFVDSNPRAKDIVTKVAIVRSKGDLWGGAHGIKLEDNPHGQKAQGFGNWVPDGIPFKEESDFNYLNIFFPNFSDDCIYTKSLWTGTPYGTVDIIYPAMKLEDMKRYDCIIFLGFHRMDSVRNDFFDDIARYVENGGIAVLSADQLKDSRDRFDPEKTEKLLGLNILDSRVVLKGPVRVKDAAVLGLDMRTYDINSTIRLKDEKEPWVYKVNVNDARVISEDSQNTPLLLMSSYGKGYTFLFTSPTLSIIPPVGRSGLVQDVMDKASRYKGLPVNISPANDNVEFLLSKTGNDKATVFLMNHGPKDWYGDVAIDLSQAGLDRGIGNKVITKIFHGYNNTEEIKPGIEKTGNNLIIKGLSIKGDTADSYSYRQANFVIIRLE